MAPTTSNSRIRQTKGRGEGDKEHIRCHPTFGHRVTHWPNEEDTEEMTQQVTNRNQDLGKRCTKQQREDIVPNTGKRTFQSDNKGQATRQEGETRWLEGVLQECWAQKSRHAPQEPAGLSTSQDYAAPDIYTIPTDTITRPKRQVGKERQCFPGRGGGGGGGDETRTF